MKHAQSMIVACFCVTLMLFAVGCGEDETPTTVEKPAAGGGVTIKGKSLAMGAAGSVIFNHDAEAGNVQIQVVGPDKKLLPVDGDIVVNAAAGRTVSKIALKAKDGVYSAAADALKNAHLEGTITLKVKGKEFKVTIPHDHAH
jgi:hypothetical protein